MPSVFKWEPVGERNVSNGKTRSWDHMTDVEREEYVNQDYVRQRETPLCKCTKTELRQGSGLDWHELMEGCQTFTGDEFERLDFLDPLERRLLELYYVEKKTYHEIARLVTVSTSIDGKVAEVQKRSPWTIRDKIKSAFAKVTVWVSTKYPL